MVAVLDCRKPSIHNSADSRWWPAKIRRDSSPQLDQITVFVKHYRSHGARWNSELIPRVLALARPNQPTQLYQFDKVASGGRRRCPRDDGILAST
jgi:hypothetical protein